MQQKLSLLYENTSTFTLSLPSKARGSLEFLYRGQAKKWRDICTSICHLILLPRQ